MAEAAETRQAARPTPAKKAEPPRNIAEDKIHTWPYLTRVEFLSAVLLMVLLTVWSFGIDAPLEEPANPAQTPNPSKAPWYFLGLQEMLVYFDPWMAGVVLPSLIIVGLMVIPYIDINPKGSGYYSFEERKFEIVIFLFGFLVLWVAMITIGVFFRGPGWNLFWPWEKWDEHKVLAITNVDLHYLAGIRDAFWAMLFGGLVCGAYYLTAVPYYFYLRRKRPNLMRILGPVRYGVVAFLFLTMMALPIKIFLRLAFNIKYIWVTPWFNV
ncbi:MAG: cytochrome C [Deltaproteobacteria bacterium]|nr:cytochrome C [Deltaproteobacteria bacterium]